MSPSSLARLRAVAAALIAATVGLGAPARSFPSIPSHVAALAKNGKPRQPIWVAVEDAHKVVKVDLRRRKVTRRFAVDGAPHNIVVNASGTVATALWGNQRIAVIRDGKADSTYLGGAPHDVKMGGGRIVVANQGAAKLNLVSLKGKPRREIDLKANPHDLAITPNGKVAWVTLEGSDDLAVVSLPRARVKRYVSTGKSPHDLLFGPHRRLWVTDWTGALHVFSRSGELLKSMSLGQEAHHLAFTPDGHQLWITDHEARRIFVINTKSFKVRKRIHIAGAPHHVAITPDGKKAAVADHDRGLVIVYRVATFTRAGRIDVGPGPHGVWAVP